MSLVEACGWTLLRSVLLALLAISVCHRLCALSAGLQSRKRLLVWSLLLTPLIVPDLLIGYAYPNFSLSLLRYPVWNELFYGLLLLMKLVPVGTVVLYFAPPAPLSAAALHCRKLAFPPATSWRVEFRQSLGFLVRGPLRAVFPAFAVMFLLGFQQFQLASLMETTSWTVWLFDAQTVGLSLKESLRSALLPLAAEAVILAAVVWLAVGKETGDRRQETGKLSCRRWSPAAWCYLVAGVCATLVVPFALVGQEAANGLTAALSDPDATANLARKIEASAAEIATSAANAMFAGVLAYLCAGWLLKKARGSRPVGLGVLVVCSLPGLLGPLILGLSLLAIFQYFPLRLLRETPIPLIIALTLFLFPRALLLQLLLREIHPAGSLHLASLLRNPASTRQAAQGRELTWQLRGRGHFWALALVCYLAYFDLTATSLLKPVRMVAAPLNLYNLIHYGHYAVLSIMTLLTMLAPVVFICLLLPLRRPLFRRLFS